MENIKSVSQKEIKRGSNITTGIESAIYSLTFLKDIVTLCSIYYYDWAEWVENDPFTDEIVSLYLERGEEFDEYIEKAEKFKNINFSSGLLKRTFDKLIVEIDNAKNVLENNGSIDIFQFAVENIKNSLQSLDTITDYLYERSFMDYSNAFHSFCFFYEFYDDVLAPVIGVGLSTIQEIVGKISQIDKRYLEITID